MEKPLRELSTALVDGRLRAMTSHLAWAECLVRPIALGDQSKMDVFERLFSTSGLLQVHPVNHAVLMEAAALKARERLALPDAIHAATCRLAGCAAFVTEDSALLKITSLPATGLGGLSVG